VPVSETPAGNESFGWHRVGCQRLHGNLNCRRDDCKGIDGYRSEDGHDGDEEDVELHFFGSRCGVAGKQRCECSLLVLKQDSKGSLTSRRFRVFFSVNTPSSPASGEEIVGGMKKNFLVSQASNLLIYPLVDDLEFISQCQQTILRGCCIVRPSSHVLADPEVQHKLGALGLNIKTELTTTLLQRR